MSLPASVGFLLENEAGWISSSLFFLSLEQLGLDTPQYYLPPGTILSAREVTIYANDVVWQLATTEVSNEYYKYALDICRRLRNWGERGHIVHVV
jgi:hypothetical protein